VTLGLNAQQVQATDPALADAMRKVALDTFIGTDRSSRSAGPLQLSSNVMLSVSSAFFAALLARIVPPILRGPWRTKKVREWLEKELAKAGLSESGGSTNTVKP
jgi:hypothetical protein